ncbi:MAG: hypothetical protein KAJ19_09205 [Gammaproteobacteria bacterium]|nr:hypothetical protein [Gammaproteobacteria bacterium]
MNNKQAKKLFKTVKEGDLFSNGKLFGRMDPEQPIFWKVLEVEESDRGLRVTFHLYYRDVFIKSLIGILTNKGQVLWGTR